ncbi:MAG: LUD domain-containing protein [Coriobacteriales bacterium]|jgi:L-lactate dehydrogenase complex protein LldG|nr:LUD domain-containing protein [Coriobacteriales bacterium]
MAETTGKERILAAVRAALSDVTVDDPVLDSPIDWQYGQATAVEQVLALFIERVEDYKAVVLSAATAAEIPQLIADCLQQAQATTVVVPPGLEPAWTTTAELDGLRILRDDPPLDKLELDGVSAVITAAAVGMAETGTIALDHRADQGRRIISLLPDTHICIIRRDQICTDVPQATARLAAAIRDKQPITWISGPSATSDIELSRVEGVHGPRNLYVLIAP